MKKYALVLPLLALLGCGVKPDDVNRAREETKKERGFSVLSARSYASRETISGDHDVIELQVSFGDKGCTGAVVFRDDRVVLDTKVPIPGTPDTRATSVEDPKVASLRKEPAFAHCFATAGA